MIAREHFLPEKNLKDVIDKGRKNHEELLAYLEQRIIVENDIDF